MPTRTTPAEYDVDSVLALCTERDAPPCLRLKVTKNLYTGQRCDVVLATLQERSSPAPSELALLPGAQVVAKVWDPRFVYYEKEQDWEGNRETYCETSADTEAGAYKKLLSANSSIAPAFYGKYYVGGAYAILIEYLPEQSLHKYTVKSDEESRDLGEAAYSLIDILYSGGVVHGDIEPWNLMWNPSTKSLKILDFEFAIVLDECDQAKFNNEAMLDWGRIVGILRQCEARLKADLPEWKTKETVDPRGAKTF
jgi:serine/threonine protein kinase